MKKASQPKALKKYKIEECLNLMNHNHYKFVRKELPKVIGKCQNTLNNYINISIDAKEELPYTIGIKLERFFGLAPGELTNEEVAIEHYSTLYQSWLEADENDSSS